MELFEPSRLTAAMRRCGMTQRDLAMRCLVSSQHISALEKGDKTPADAMIKRISEVLGFPIEFFYGDRVDLVDPSSVSFRSRRSMASSTRDMGLGMSDIAVGVVTPDLHRRFTLPKVDVPDLSAHSPQAAADILRARWNLGFEPVQNVVHLLESRGVMVYWLNVDSQHMDAISLWKGDQPFVFLNTQKKAGDRGRFDAAHELGHLVLHRGDEKELSEKQIEDQADSFASAFLLPAERFQLECPPRPDFAALYKLKARWKVSAAAMVMRGAELGLFSEWQKRQAFQFLNASGARTNEKTPIPREQSKLHVMVFDALMKKGISPASYAALLHVREQLIKELMPTAERAGAPPVPPVKKEIQQGKMRLVP